MKKKFFICIFTVLSAMLIVFNVAACSSYTKSLVFYENTENGPYLYGVGDMAVVDITDKGIEKVVIPATYKGKSVSIIGLGVFGGCPFLEEVVFPESIKYISDGAFGDCGKLKNLSFPNSLLYIGKRAFKDDTELSTLNIGNNIEMIYIDAFKNCGNLKDVYFKGTKEEWESIKISEGNDCLLKADIHFEN